MLPEFIITSGPLTRDIDFLGQAFVAVLTSTFVAY